MNTLTKHISVTVFTLALFLTAMLAFSPLVFAHGHEEHDEDTTAEASKHEMSVPELEQMLSLLKQLMALIIEHKQVAYQEGKKATVEEHHDKDATHDEHDMDMEDHKMTSTEKKLTIEVETHTGKTHVHARFVDKPEAMFYVDAALTDETKLVADIATKTGLSAEEIKPALKYLGGN